MRASVLLGAAYAASLAAAVWVALWRLELVPFLLAAALALGPGARRSRAVDPWAGLVVLGSAAVNLAVTGGWLVAGGWLVLASVVAAVTLIFPLHRGSRPDAADLVALTGWAGGFALRPELVGLDRGGMLAPAVLLLAARQLAGVGWVTSRAAGRALPPSRRVRGTLSLRGVVLSGLDGLPRSVPIDLELRAGESLAVVCDSAADADALADVISGRRSPREGEVAVDGVPLEADDRLVTVVAQGEALIPGDLDDNLVALCEEDLDQATRMAIEDACSLGEVSRALEGRQLTSSGVPLEPLHRLLVLAARVIPSTYRIVVVVDPSLWVNAVHGELWRAAVVRASVGRTAIWLTADRDLAGRAAQVMELRHGALRPRRRGPGEG